MIKGGPKYNLAQSRTLYSHMEKIYGPIKFLIKKQIAPILAQKNSLNFLGPRKNESRS